MRNKTEKRKNRERFRFVFFFNFAFVFVVVSFVGDNKGTGIFVRKIAQAHKDESLIYGRRS